MDMAGRNPDAAANTPLSSDQAAHLHRALSSDQAAQLRRVPSAHAASWTTHESCFNAESHDFVKGNSIGSGSFSQVFEGTFKGRRVAAKQHHAFTPAGLELYGIADDPDGFAVIVREVEAEIEAFLRVGRHPHLLDFVGIGVGYLKGQPMPVYILSEFIKEGTLEPWLKNNAKDDEMGRVVVEICQGLDFMHGRNFIHRDVKPANILLKSGHTVKLADFGLAATRGGPSIRTRTQTGTPSYAAPEIAMSGKYGSKVDIYALGCIILSWLQHDEPAPAHKRRLAQLEGISSKTPFRRVACQCVDTDPNSRPTASEVIARMETVEETVEETVGETTMPCRCWTM